MAPSARVTFTDLKRPRATSRTPSTGSFPAQRRSAAVLLALMVLGLVVDIVGIGLVIPVMAAQATA